MKYQMKHKNYLSLLLIALFFQAAHAPKVNSQQAQLQPGDNPPPFDFRKERAADLTFSVGVEASGLKSVPDKIALQLGAARVLAAVRQDQAIQLLDSAWDILAEVIKAEKTTETDRYLATTLRGDVLALYARLDPDRAKKLAKSLPPPSSGDDEGGGQRKSPLDVSPDRQRADYLAQAGLEKLGRDPAAGISAAVSSLNTGKVSLHLSSLPKAIFTRAGREAVDDFENRVATVLSNRSSLDSQDYMAVADLLGADAQMPASARRGLVNFLLNSLERLGQSIRQNTNKQFSEAEIHTQKSAYSTFARRVRPHVAKDLPDKLNLFDSHLGEVAAAVPQSWLDFNYELWTTDSAEDQLTRALKTPDRRLRDTRLMNFTIRALNGKLPDRKEDRLELASKAVAEINDGETKLILSDFLRMAEVMKLAGERSWAPAADKARAISRPDWRAWVLLGLADAHPKESPNAVLALHEEARHALEKSSASPRAAALLFLLAKFVSSYDQPRAMEIITSAVKCANQAARAGVTASTKPSLLQSFYVHLGGQHFAPGQELTGVDKIELGDEIGGLALYDWAWMESAGRDIEDIGLRLRYQLALSKSVLADARVK